MKINTYLAYVEAKYIFKFELQCNMGKYQGQKVHTKTLHRNEILGSTLGLTLSSSK